MDGWFKIAGVAVTATVAAVMAIAAYYESQRRQNEMEYSYGNPNRERTNNSEFRAINNQRQSSRDPEIERKLREAELKRAEKLAKLREERQKQLKEVEKKRKEEEDEKKRKREEEEKERKKNEQMKCMLDSFDDAFDNEIGVKTERKFNDENIDDWSRNAEKQKLKDEFRAKQMAQHQKSQDEKDKINSNNSTDDLKIEQQKCTITKSVISKKFRLQEFLLNAIINVNIENNFTLALSLKCIKKNKRKKVIDLQELDSAVFSFQEIAKENESSNVGAIPKKLKKKVKKRKGVEKQTDVQKKQENELKTEKNFANSNYTFAHKKSKDYLWKLELEEKKRKEVIVEWKLRRQLRQQYTKLALTKSFKGHSNNTPLQKQMVNQKRTVNLEVNRTEEAERMNANLNFYDHAIIYEDSYNLRRLDQLSELMSQTKSNFAQYQETKNEAEKINGHVEIDKLKIVKQKSTTLEPACNKKFKCPNFVLYAIINVNTTNQDTVASSLSGIEKNKKKKVIDLQELESAVCDLQEILLENDSLQHRTPLEKVKKPKTQEQIAARKRRKQLRKQRGMMQQYNAFGIEEIKIAVCN